MTWSVLYNALLTAFIFLRVSRCDRREAQVLFGDKAIITFKDGKWLFHLRVYDMDSKYPVVESHIRLYCASWLNIEEQQASTDQPNILQVMRIIEPDDDYGSALFTSVPFRVTHQIDPYSPLAPPHKVKNLSNMKGHGLFLREADQLSGNANGVSCPVCGDAFESFEQLEKHVAFNKIIEDADSNIPYEGTHRDVKLVMPTLVEKFELTKDDLVEFLKDKEIICVVEGIERLVSGTFQALHSYRLEDIVFGGQFAQCCSHDRDRTVMDLDKFHKIVPVKNSTDSYQSL
jgi:hypothetical protein